MAIDQLKTLDKPHLGLLIDSGERSLNDKFKCGFSVGFVYVFFSSNSERNILPSYDLCGSRFVIQSPIFLPHMSDFYLEIGKIPRHLQCRAKSCVFLVQKYLKLSQTVLHMA